MASTDNSAAANSPIGYSTIEEHAIAIIRRLIAASFYPALAG
jgi:hypothetical protein